MPEPGFNRYFKKSNVAGGRGNGIYETIARRNRNISGGDPRINEGNSFLPSTRGRSIDPRPFENNQYRTPYNFPIPTGLGGANAGVTRNFLDVSNGGSGVIPNLGGLGSGPSTITISDGGRAAASSNYTADAEASGGAFTDSPVYIIDPGKRTAGLNRFYFPFTPTVSMALSTSHSSYDMTHSNFQQKAFESSQNAEITVVGQVVARDATEADYVLKGYNFFRASMKMNWENDELAGFPPPVLRFYAYNIHTNVPVVINSFAWNFEDPSVDHISYDSEFGKNTSIPKVSTFVLGLTTTYGPKNVRENFSVRDYSLGELKNKGYI